MTNHLTKYCFKVFKSMAKIKLKHVCCFFAAMAVLDFFGAFTHIFELNYNENFAYPYEGDIYGFVNDLKHGKQPSVQPINQYNYTYIIKNDQKCVEKGYKNFRVVYIVKSAIQNFERRMAIRSTWGFEKRFFDVPFKTIFVLGTHSNDEELLAKVKAEASKHRDIVQADFIDTYYNNTIKTMMSFKWAVNYCPNSKFYMFVDDDIYVSVKNVLRFVRNPAYYPDYLKEQKQFRTFKREIRETTLGNNINDDYKNDTTTLMDDNNNNNDSTENLYENRTHEIDKRQVFDIDLPDNVRLFAGYVFVSSPHRHKTSKWYVSLKEYPYHLWPPYVTAGAYVLSKEALSDMYYASMYTKHFRFDDIFLGLVAKKADIEPFHCEEFHFYKKDYTKYNYKYVITSHGYGDPRELLQVWNEQKALGNA